MNLLEKHWKLAAFALVLLYLNSKGSIAPAAASTNTIAQPAQQSMGIDDPATMVWY